MKTIYILKGEEFRGVFQPDHTATDKRSFNVVNTELDQQVEVWLPPSPCCVACDFVTPESDLETLVPGEQVLLTALDYVDGPPCHEGESSGVLYSVFRFPQPPPDETQVPSHPSPQ